MIIRSTLIEANKIVCDLQLDDAYHQESLVQNKIVLNDEGQHADIRCKILYMPGLCILDTGFSIYKPVTDTFIIEGEHLRITLFFDGNSRVWEKGGTDFYDLQTGIMRRQYQKTTRWDIEMIPNREVSYVAILMSKNYLMQLLANEKWAAQDEFLVGIFNSDESICEEQRYFIDVSIKKVLYEILSEDYEHTNRRNYLELKLKEMLFLLYTQQEISHAIAEVSPDVYNKLVMAKAFLLGHLTQPPTIKQLARIVSLNELKLKQAFKSTYGTTIHAFVIKTRMQKARQMLTENCSVADMSTRLGYHSVSHFIETFKKHYGETPKQALSKLFRIKYVLYLFVFLNEIFPYALEAC